MAIVTPAEVLGGGVLTDVADVTLNNGSQTTVIDAFALQRGVVIQADPANTVEIRIGADGTVGAARGLGLSPGAAMSLETTAKICAWATAAAQKVRVLAVRN